MVLSHSLAPCHRDQFEHVAKFIPPIPKEPAVAMHNDFARRLAGSGFYGPFRVRDGEAVIEDRARHPMLLGLQVVGPANAREAAEIAVLALNLLCGFAAAATDTGPMADAAE